MNIIVSAAALRTGGALTIYKQFLYHLSEFIKKNNYYIFIDKSMPCPNIEGVKYIVVDVCGYVKRELFDWYLCAKILKEKGIEPDIVVSLQNTALKCLKNCKQILYYHQPLPFYSQKWNPLKKEERTPFFYKYIYPYFVKTSLTKDIQVVVQIPFIKKEFCKLFQVPPKNVHVLFPDIEKIDMNTIESYNWQDDKIHFIYPAAGVSYKMHKTIIESLNIIRFKSPIVLERIIVHFTLKISDVPELYTLIKSYNLVANINFAGTIPHEELLSMYKGATALLFPSIIETLGLPLLEAAAFGLPILVSDLDYSREVIGKYDGAILLPAYDYQLWADHIIKISNLSPSFRPLTPVSDSSWNEFFEILTN